MERRLAISQKRAQSRYENSELDSVHPLHSHYYNHQVHQNTGGVEATDQPLVVAKLETQLEAAATPATSAIDRQPRSRSSSNDRGSRSRRRVSSNSGTPAPQDGLAESPAMVTGSLLAISNSAPAKRSSKRRIPITDTPSKLEVVTPKKKKAKQTEMRTKMEYTSLNLPLHKHSKRAIVLEYSTQNSTSSDYGTRNHGDGVCGERDPLGSQSTSSCGTASVHGSDAGHSLANGVEDSILVPSWRTRVSDTPERMDADDIMEVSSQL